MKRIKLELKDLSPEELVSFALRAKAKLESETTFNSLEADLTKLAGAATSLEGRNNNFKSAEQLVISTLDLRDTQRREVERLLRVLGVGVEHTAAGDTQVLLASPFELQAEPTPVGPMPAPQNVRVTASEMEGEIIARWKTVRGAKSYVVECCLEGAPDWSQAGVTTKARITLKGLNSGKKYRVRVRAVGAAGTGPWSDEALKMAA